VSRGVDPAVPSQRVGRASTVWGANPTTPLSPRRGGGVRGAVWREVPRLALTVTEAAHALGVSDDFFREHVAGELRWVRRGRKKLVSISELEKWLDRSAARTLD
jgi:excisionase family DNA binding protein